MKIIQSLQNETIKNIDKLKDKKVQVGLTIVTVVAGTISGLVVKKLKNKRRDKCLLQELEDSTFDNLDL